MSERIPDALTALRYMSEGYDNNFNAGTPLMALHVAAVEKQVAELEADHASVAKAYDERYHELLEARASLQQAEVELVERDRMLDFVNPWRRQENKDKWLADLRARAERGAK